MSKRLANGRYAYLSQEFGPLQLIPLAVLHKLTPVIGVHLPAQMCDFERALLIIKVGYCAPGIPLPTAGQSSEENMDERGGLLKIAYGSG